MFIMKLTKLIFNKSLIPSDFIIISNLIKSIIFKMLISLILRTNLLYINVFNNLILLIFLSLKKC